MVAAKNAVNVATTKTIFNANGLKLKIKLHLLTIYTPAVTIVAACINALTAVGPAIASGSQTYKGN